MAIATMIDRMVDSALPISRNWQASRCVFRQTLHGNVGTPARQAACGARRVERKQQRFDTRGHS